MSVVVLYTIATFGTPEIVLIIEVSLFQSVLITEVSLFQSVLIREVPLYVYDKCIPFG